MLERLPTQENIPQGGLPPLSYEDSDYESALAWRNTEIEYREGTMNESAEFPLVNPIQPNDFDRQFNARTMLDHADQTTNQVDIVDITPELAKTDVPLMIAPGFSEGPKTLEENMRYLSGWGRRVLTYDAPYGISPEVHKNSSTKKAENAQVYELGKAATLNKVLEQKELARVDAVGHSEGCINLVIAALEHPERFRNLVLVNPGGMVGETSTFEFIKRVWNHFYAEKRAVNADPRMHEVKIRSEHERKHNILAEPKKSLRAARAVACSEIGDLLKALKEQGIGISIIHSVDDAIFPMDKIQETAHKGQFDGFYSVKGGHNDFFLNPEPYTMLVDHALDALARKQEKERARHDEIAQVA